MRRLIFSLAVSVLLVPVSQVAFSQQNEDSSEIAPPFIVEKYRNQAESGDTQAQFRLGYLYEHGLVSGVPEIEMAANWYGLAASGGHASAQFKRARMHADGIAGPRNYSAAAELYEKAARQGMGEAQYNFAILLQDGLGTERNVDAAIRWYEQAAFRGIVPAMQALGLLYLSGVGKSPQDDIEAWAWLTLAVENGDGAMTNRLARVEAGLDAPARAEALKLADAYRQLRIHP